VSFTRNRLRDFVFFLLYYRPRGYVFFDGDNQKSVFVLAPKITRRYANIDVNELLGQRVAYTGFYRVHNRFLDPFVIRNIIYYVVV